jgi:hypothetical protein
MSIFWPNLIFKTLRSTDSKNEKNLKNWRNFNFKGPIDWGSKKSDFYCNHLLRCQCYVIPQNVKKPKSLHATG